MTIQEAIKSGKPFKRPGWTVWLDARETFVYVGQDYAGEKHTLIGRDAQMFPEDIIATDWEIKP